MKRHLGTIALVMFGLSLPLPALAVIEKPIFGGGSHDTVILGVQCLLTGFFVWPGWIANPLLLASWCLRAVANGRPRQLLIATWLAVLALVSAASAPFWLASATQPMELRYPHVGYFLWLGSILVSVLAMHLARLDAIDRIAAARTPSG